MRQERSGIHASLPLRADIKAETHEFVTGNAANHYNSHAPHSKPYTSPDYKQDELSDNLMY